jgi:hypothetical protein
MAARFGFVIGQRTGPKRVAQPKPVNAVAFDDRPNRHVRDSLLRHQRIVRRQVSANNPVHCPFGTDLGVCATFCAALRANRYMSSTRLLLTLLFSAAGAIVASSQDDELVPAAYLAATYTAPSDAPSNVVIAGPGEPGQRLVVTGRVLEGVRPIAGASLFVFHTDAAGRYAPDKSGNDAELHPRLRGLLRTDSEGRYRYETIRPGSYGKNAAHVHYVVKATDYKTRLLDLWFEDDPILVARRANGEPEVPPSIRKSSYYIASSDVVAIRPLRRDATGVWHTTRDIQMFKR